MLPTIKELFDLTQTEHRSLFAGVTYPWEILSKLEEYIIKHGKVIGNGTTIAKTAVVEDHVIIGQHCEIRPGAYIRAHSIIGDHCIIGNSTEIKNALLFNRVIVPHYNYVGDSILGYKTHLGAGVIISNCKSDGSEIKVTNNTEVYNTGLRKFGAILGDSVEVGSNAVLNPGTIIGKNTVIYPLALVRGIIADHQILKIRQQQEMVLQNPPS